MSHRIKVVGQPKAQKLQILGVFESVLFYAPYGGCEIGLSNACGVLKGGFLDYVIARRYAQGIQSMGDIAAENIGELISRN